MRADLVLAHLPVRQDGQKRIGHIVGEQAAVVRVGNRGATGHIARYPVLDFCDLDAFPKPGDMNRSILIMDVHPSKALPEGSTTAEPFSPEAIYELRIDTDGDLVADIGYRFDSRRRRTGRRARRSAASTAPPASGIAEREAKVGA